MNKKIIFDVQHLYYLPQFLPVYRELKSRGIECQFVFYTNADVLTILQQVVITESLECTWVKSESESLQYYQANTPDWIIFGNAYTPLANLPSNTKSALLYHGIGVKDCYYDAELAEMHVRFVEGPHRMNEIQRRYPHANLKAVGFAKLDPLFSDQQSYVRDIEMKNLGLSPEKPTLLYAPTFYPSSIELMPDDWPQTLAHFNIIIKPHYFTMIRSSYSRQKNKINLWKNAENVYVANVEDYSLLPFFQSADLLISEASSALFEFAALDKPVVWCDFIKLRWSYRGPLKFRFNKRMDQSILKYRDIGMHVDRFSKLSIVIRHQLENATEYSSMRQQYTQELIGTTDGRVSQRIVNYLIADLSSHRTTG